MPLNNILDRIVTKDLTVQTGKIAEKARENASWSKTIPDAISVGKTEKRGGRFESSIILDLKKAPQAAAFEYGSGEHGESGEAYTIPGMPWLAIPRERWPKYNPPPDIDPIVLSSVEHPGVEARPFLQPAIEQGKEGLVNALKKSFIQAYRESVVRVTVISAKK